MDRGIWIWIQSVSDVVAGRMEGIFLLAAGMEWEQTLAFLFHESVCTSKAKLVHASALVKTYSNSSPIQLSLNVFFIIFYYPP